jgi:hypothetical protein
MDGRRWRAGVKAMRSAGGVAPVVERLQAWLPRDDGAEQVEALTRVLAMCTSVDKSMAAELEAAGGVSLVLRVAGDLTVSAAAAGNACLCVGDCAAHDGALKTLAKADAVAALVPVAQKRSGTCQRNAGIALAKMAARDDGCKARLVELRGLEVMHAYVKP